MKEQVINQLKALLKEHSNRYTVHELAAPLLEAASKDRSFLDSVIRGCLSDPGFLSKKRHYPTLSMPVVESPEFSLVVNIFPPLPTRETGISFQSIHHHGALLLTTVGVIGPGYESMVFKKGFEIDTATGITKMQMERVYQNPLHKAEFIDSNQPHVVFYPEDFSATIAFWCADKPSAKESLKKLSWMNSLKKPAAKIATMLGADKLLGINKVEYFDFYIEQGSVHALKNRLAYDAVGDNENFLQNIFCFVQKTGFSDTEFLNELLLKENTSGDAKKYIRRLLDQQPIEDRFYEGHLNIKGVNLKKSDITDAMKHA